MAVQPGETCGVCKRRVPHPKKPSSPSETHPLSFGRAPADTVQELKDRVNALAEDAGLSRLPYPQARTVMLLLTLAEVVSRETLLEVASGMSWGTTEIANRDLKASWGTKPAESVDVDPRGAADDPFGF